MTSVKVVVPDDFDGARADKILAVVLAVPRSTAREIINRGDAVVQEVAVKPGQNMRAGTVIVAIPPAPEPDLVPDTNVPFEIAYEDEAIAIVDKPAGIVVHPGSGRGRGTLVNGLIARYPEIVGVGQQDRWGIVHRIDKDTSGLLVVARTQLAYDALILMMQAREVSRRYLSLVRHSFTSTIGTIDAPIGRDPVHRTRMHLDGSGRSARTHYRRLAQWTAPGAALLSISLETGRTHQIRVHMRSIGHPVIGDRVYGRQGGPGDPGRPWLHARQLAFQHPQTGRELDFLSRLPIDLSESLAALGSPETGSAVDINGELL